ncbi:putative type-1 restriction enzyme specificity protein [Photorhabdus australis subsp. thailandensis]|uniref:Putative type-1 restriction enzyme specificity protein n=1 Tax=Photorhabdus australis subsp. thailandensis TaxID=2805096 RepID=A0A1C0U5S8_9GAMM|nr:restriction endonuclease subunit S [Photorhabdus australis]OCQ53284.1 putative type-1 restriction enzyme specificity protein [Photorhabdus australis subsp. thailandensis]
MSNMSFMEKLLDGVEVEWMALGEVAKIKHGKDWKRLNSGDIPVYGSGGIMGYVDTYSYNKPTVLIPRKGSITNIFYIESPFWNVDTIYYTEINTKKIIPKFLYYFIKTIDLLALDTGSGRPSLTQAVLNKIQIPIPLLHIQEEIVRILDTFTELTAKLTAKLTAEFTARKKQYNYYRDQLLSFEESEVEWKTLGEIGEVRMCKRILKNQTLETGDIPFYKIGTFGKKPNAFITRELFDEYKAKYSYPKTGEVLISASGTVGRSVIFDGKDAYFQDSNIVWIENDESQVLNKYLFYFYQIANWNISDGGVIKRLYNDNIKKTTIPVPYPSDSEKSLVEQDRIVAILDKFDALTSSISEGLPREIELRQKQYEYYRDLLLSFPKPGVEA